MRKRIKMFPSIYKMVGSEDLAKGSRNKFELISLMSNTITLNNFISHLIILHLIYLCQIKLKSK